MQDFPRGFSFSTAAAGFRKADRDDLAVVVSDVPAVVAGVFTLAAFKAAPVLVGQEMLEANPRARAVLINAGCANACTGDQGLKNCRETLQVVGNALNIEPGDILPASTGVIGTQHDMDKWRAAMPQLTENLGHKSLEDFARAIMTTDAFPKYTSHTLEFSGGTVRLMGVAKGAGMICPNMATMLSTILCDAEVDPVTWKEMLVAGVDRTFNRVTVDGDTSTNDTLYALANGMSGVKITGPEDLARLQEALDRVLASLSYMLVQDGEGSTKVLRISVQGAKNDADAEKVARTVGNSPLVKTAMFGKDPNWGRIVAAVGRSYADFSPGDVRVSLCGVEIFRNEQPVDMDVDIVFKELLEAHEVHIDIHIGSGPGTCLLFASDLSHAYVDCNASYRS